MEMHPIFHFPPPWSFFFSPFQSSPFAPPNYVHWRETASSHLHSASLPGIRKEEIRVEIENSAYLLIQTELNNTGTEIPAAQTGNNNLEDGTEGGTKQKRFYRKFRLPVRVDLDGVTARYENGLLTVTVPRLIHRAGFRIGFSDLDRVDNSVARAA